MHANQLAYTPTLIGAIDPTLGLILHLSIAMISNACKPCWMIILKFKNRVLTCLWFLHGKLPYERG